MNIKEYISSGIIEAYVLGLATEEEVNILQCVSKKNSEVEQAILEAQSVLNNLSKVQQVAAPPDLKNAIWSKLKQESTDNVHKLEKENYTEVKESSLGKSIFDWKITAIAASVLCVMTLGTTLFFINKSKKTTENLNSIIADNKATIQDLTNLKEKWSLFQNPNLKTITLVGVEQHPNLLAHVFWNEKTTEVYLSSENLPLPPEDMQYQLWAIVDGVPIDAGVFNTNENVSVNKMLNISKAQAFAITLEKSGGNPTPTLTQLYVMGNI